MGPAVSTSSKGPKTGRPRNTALKTTKLRAPTIMRFQGTCSPVSSNCSDSPNVTSAIASYMMRFKNLRQVQGAASSAYLAHFADYHVDVPRQNQLGLIMYRKAGKRTAEQLPHVGVVFRRGRD